MGKAVVHPTVIPGVRAGHDVPGILLLIPADKIRRHLIVRILGIHIRHAKEMEHFMGIGARCGDGIEKAGVLHRFPSLMQLYFKTICYALLCYPIRIISSSFASIIGICHSPHKRITFSNCSSSPGVIASKILNSS